MKRKNILTFETLINYVINLDYFFKEIAIMDYENVSFLAGWFLRSISSSESETSKFPRNSLSCKMPMMKLKSTLKPRIF